MNYGRLVAAAVVASIVDMVYGALVYGQALSGQFAQFPAVFRSTDTQAAYMPTMMVGIVVGMLAATWIYSKGYEGRSGAVEGARFGLVMGAFLATYAWITNYSIMNIGGRFTMLIAIAGLVEWTIVGTTIGLVYKPAAAARRTAATV